MIFLGQFTGINAIMYYMSVLMSQEGFDKYQSNYMSLVGGGSLLLGTIPAIFLMETCGRRFWAIAMLPGFFIGLVLIGVSYHLPVGSSASLGVVSCLATTSYDCLLILHQYFTGLITYEVFFGSYA